jgi:hypothetical protein
MEKPIISFFHGNSGRSRNRARRYRTATVSCSYQVSFRRRYVAYLKKVHRGGIGRDGSGCRESKTAMFGIRRVGGSKRRSKLSLRDVAAGHRTVVPTERSYWSIFSGNLSAGTPQPALRPPCWPGCVRCISAFCISLCICSSLTPTGAFQLLTLKGVQLGSTILEIVLKFYRIAIKQAEAAMPTSALSPTLPILIAARFTRDGLESELPSSSGSSCWRALAPATAPCCLSSEGEGFSRVAKSSQCVSGKDV